jgi:hypothetical protein
MKKLSILLILVLASNYLLGQSIDGKVKNVEGMSIEFATVILQSIDSVFISATITNEEGYFSIPIKNEINGVLLVQHINHNALFHVLNEECNETIDIILEPKINQIEEITITANRPFLTVLGKTLTYDVEQISEKKIVSNAYEVIRELPGIVELNENIQLIGAHSVTLILNGQVSTISQEQFYDILKNIPATNIKNVEVMYNAPSKYNIRGALINIITKKQVHEKSILGNITGRYLQSRYASGSINSNINYKTKKKT